MNAQRMFQSERIYQDFLQFTPPGADLLCISCYKLVFPHIWVTSRIWIASERSSHYGILEYNGTSLFKQSLAI
jgi:hypothetical protein